MKVSLRLYEMNDDSGWVCWVGDFNIVGRGKTPEEAREKAIAEFISKLDCHTEIIKVEI